MTSGQKLARYFLHGIIFSVLNLILTILWAFLTFGLVVVGLFLGLAVAIVILFLFYGFINTLITEYVWKVKLKRNLSSIFLHGMVLFFVTLIASIPAILIQSTAPSILGSIIIFIVYCFVDGFLARNIARYWEVKSVPIYSVQYPPQERY